MVLLYGWLNEGGEALSEHLMSFSLGYKTKHLNRKEGTGNEVSQDFAPGPLLSHCSPNNI